MEVGEEEVVEEEVEEEPGVGGGAHEAVLDVLQAVAEDHAAVGHGRRAQSTVAVMTMCARRPRTPPPAPPSSHLTTSQHRTHHPGHRTHHPGHRSVDT